MRKRLVCGLLSALLLFMGCSPRHGGETAGPTDPRPSMPPLLEKVDRVVLLPHPRRQPVESVCVIDHFISKLMNLWGRNFANHTRGLIAATSASVLETPKKFESFVVVLLFMICLP